MSSASRPGFPRSQRLARVSTTRYLKRRRVREQLRHYRRMMTLVKARKVSVIAAVGGAIVAVLAMGGTIGAIVAHHWWLR